MGTKMNTYDDLIKKEYEDFFTDDYDWRLYKAQIKAESNFDTNAVSPVGAMGLAQFMPETWNEVCLDLAFPPDVQATDPSVSILAGAYYMSKMLKGWTSPRPPMDRYCLALASYNAGFGSLLKAQKLAGGINDYASIIAQLYKVTGGHATETYHYVKKILNAYNRYLTSGV